MQTFLRFIFVLALALVGTSAPAADAAASPASAPAAIALPAAPDSFGLDLAAALKARKTDREYGPGEVTPAELAKVLWAANGVNRENGKRTAPTPRGFYFINTYVTGQAGTFLFDAKKSELTPINAENLVAKVGIQPYIGSASHVLMLTARLSLYTGDQPREHKIATAYTTAGCIAQNVYLAAAALKLSTCLVFSQKEDEIRKGLGLKDEEVPLFIMPLGRLK